MRPALAEVGEAIVVTVTAGVATVQLNRPDKHNAVNLAMWQALARLLPELDEDPAVEVVVLRGTPGGPFSAGADVEEFRSLRSTADSAAAYGEAVAAGEAALLGCAKPTVALVEGFAIGGGTQLALACDLRVCEPGSRFGITPAKLGIVYGLASTARLVDVVGSAWASWILLTGDLIDAPTAMRIGLVHEVNPDAEARVREIAGTLTQRAQVSLRGAKALIRKVSEGQRTEDDEVRRHYRDSLHSPEYAEGVTAFLAKRAPDFRAARTPPSRE